VGQTSYAVQTGDTIYSIAAKFNVPVGRITANNTSVNFSAPLSVGQSLCI
jgi:LysM repeat protein